MSWSIRIEGLGKKYRRGEVLQLSDNFRESLMRVSRKMLSKINPFSTLADHKSDQSSEFWALQDINLEIKPGEVVGIIGRNGAGKSTLLKILSRITAPTCGSIRYRGSMASLLEVGTGFHRELTGRENIFLNGSILGMRRFEIVRKFDEILDFAGVEKFIDTPVKFYSSGMYMRLAFSIAAHLSPEILVVDEVLAVGDASFQKKCLGKMADVSKQGMTVLFVSHNLGAIQALCKRSIMLSDGKIFSDGDSANTILKYLAHGQNDHPVREYEKDEAKLIQIMKVSLLNHRHEPSVQLDMLNEFTVEIEYEVRNRVEGVVIGANILTSLNDSLIATCDCDLNRERLKHRNVGRHKTWVKFPKKLFNSGTFSLVIGISVPGKYVYDRQEVMQFELVDSGSFVVSGGGETRRNALLLLELPWDT